MAPLEEPMTFAKAILMMAVMVIVFAIILYIIMMGMNSVRIFKDVPFQ